MSSMKKQLSDFRVTEVKSVLEIFG